MQLYLQLYLQHNLHNLHLVWRNQNCRQTCCPHQRYPPWQFCIAPSPTMVPTMAELGLSRTGLSPTMASLCFMLEEEYSSTPSCMATEMRFLPTPLFAEDLLLCSHQLQDLLQRHGLCVIFFSGIFCVFLLAVSTTPKFTPPQ